MNEKYQDKRQTIALLLANSLRLNPVCYWYPVDWNEFLVYGPHLPPTDEATQFGKTLQTEG